MASKNASKMGIVHMYIKMIGFITLLVIANSCSNDITADYSGYIVSDKTQQPIQGVSVKEINTGKAVISDKYGFFHFDFESIQTYTSSKRPTELGVFVLFKLGYKTDTLYSFVIQGGESVDRTIKGEKIYMTEND